MTKSRFPVPTSCFRLMFFCIILLFNNVLWSQPAGSTTITGTVIDSSSKSVLAGTTLQVLREGETAVFRGVRADSNGRFSMTVPTGQYILLASHSGYRTYRSKLL